MTDNTDTVSTANVFLFVVNKVVTQGRDIERLEIKMLKKVDAMSQYFVKNQPSCKFWNSPKEKFK